MLTTFKRSLLLVDGVLALMLGVIGAFLPLLPTVPLILLAAYCFSRSSDPLLQWLMRHRYFGPLIKDFQANKGVSRSIKYRAIVMLWLSISVSCWLVGHLWLCAILVVIAASVTFYLLRLPEGSKNNKGNKS